MTEISICSLIYRSIKYAKSVHQSLMDHTPALHDGRARFFFVANDATPEVLEWLEQSGIDFVVQENEHRTEEELFSMGYAHPEYIHRVYRGWNRAIQESDEACVLVNSDNMFSDGWLEALLESWHPDQSVLVSRLVEPPPRTRGGCTCPGAIVYPFGWSIDDYCDDEFQAFVPGHTSPRFVENPRSFMPCIFSRSRAIKVGMYPEGNLAKGSFKHVLKCGDREFFDRLTASGLRHICIYSSLVYHFREGEMRYESSKYKPR